MSGDHLYVFTRYPEPGKTKTRLIPKLGADCAACLQHAMTTHILTVASEVKRRRGTHIEVRFEGGNDTVMREDFGLEFDYREQGSGDLGDRMQRCVRDGLASGAQSVVIMGSDVPGISKDILDAAFEGLRTHDLVIGPAADGGYYLIGLRADIPDIFQNMPWGTEDVLRMTLDTVWRLGMSVCTLPVIADVDRPEDLLKLEHAWGKERLTEAIGRVSVIIPVLNEANRIEAVIKEIADNDSTVEIVVVDGGSTDDTAERAEACEAKVLRTAPGRARQMNAGAEAATGGILLFLHADTQLPAGFSSHVRTALRKRNVAAGAFQFHLDAGGISYRILERLVNWRSRVLQMPYGDQALFMKTGIFRSLKGFPDMPVMEDFEMVRRLKRRGKIIIVPVSAVTSARRWKKRGFLKTTMLNQAMIAGYSLGVHPEALAQQYRGRTPK